MIEIYKRGFIINKLVAKFPDGYDLVTSTEGILTVRKSYGSNLKRDSVLVLAAKEWSYAFDTRTNQYVFV